MVWILSSKTRTLARWVMSPANLNIFIIFLFDLCGNEYVCLDQPENTGLAPSRSDSAQKFSPRSLIDLANLSFFFLQIFAFDFYLRKRGGNGKQKRRILARGLARGKCSSPCSYPNHFGSGFFLVRVVIIFLLSTI